MPTQMWTSRPPRHSKNCNRTVSARPVGREALGHPAPSTNRNAVHFNGESRRQEALKLPHGAPAPPAPARSHRRTATLSPQTTHPPRRVAHPPDRRAKTLKSRQSCAVFRRACPSKMRKHSAARKIEPFAAASPASPDAPAEQPRTAQSGDIPHDCRSPPSTARLPCPTTA